MCRWQQTSPDSVFTRKRVCSRATPQGRITLTATSLIVTSNGARTETHVDTVEQFERLLREQFHMSLAGFPAITA